MLAGFGQFQDPSGASLDVVSAGLETKKCRNRLRADMFVPWSGVDCDCWLGGSHAVPGLRVAPGKDHGEGRDRSVGHAEPTWPDRRMGFATRVSRSSAFGDGLLFCDFASIGVYEGRH